jgi:hypothetical protein
VNKVRVGMLTTSEIKTALAVTTPDTDAWREICAEIASRVRAGAMSAASLPTSYDPTVYVMPRGD